jgi:hypothetical protein
VILGLQGFRPAWVIYIAVFFTVTSALGVAKHLIRRYRAARKPGQEQEERPDSRSPARED